MRTLCLLLMSVLPLAADPGQGKGKGKAKGRDSSERRGVQVTVFRAEDRRIITEYYRAQPSGLPPGLAKRGGDLPPGLEKQLRRNGRLPPGLEKRLVPFPVELERQLPPLPAGYQRGMIGGRAVILDRGRSVVLDVMAVFR